MAANRAQKSGFAAEAQAKMNAKYDDAVAHEAMAWINDRISAIGEGPINTSGSADNVYEVLEDGYVLCALMKAIEPSSIKTLKRQKLAFKKMENINAFLEAIEKYGVAKHDSFQTVDLYERTNLTQVVLSLHALGRKVNSKGGKGIGPKESERQSREWTEEQLKAGQNVIGLQMGSNKGASQAGQNFGKARHIVD